MFIPHDLEQGKVVMAAVYGGELVGIEGNYDDVNRFCSELIGDPLGEGWGFVNVNLRPYYGEGSKTLAYEICEQLGWRLPDQLVIPIASGSQLTKIDKGLQELIKLGLVEDKPYKIFGAQAEGCSPVSTAFKAGHDVVRPQKPNTIAKSLAIGNPADGPYVLDIARRTGGAVEDVNDEQIVDAIKLLARTEGIFAETAGGVTVGVTKKLIESGPARPGPDHRRAQHRRRPEDPGRGGPDDRPDRDIRPSLDAFRDAGRSRSSRAPDGTLSTDGRHPMSVNVRIPTILRTYTGGQAEVAGRGRDPRRGHRRPGEEPHRASPPASWTTRASCAASSTCTSTTTTSASSRAWRRRRPDGAGVSIIPGRRRRLIARRAGADHPAVTAASEFIELPPPREKRRGQFCMVERGTVGEACSAAACRAHMRMPPEARQEAAKVRRLFEPYVAFVRPDLP